MKKSLWVKVFATEWNQCVQVDRIEWTGSALLGFRGDTKVLFVNVAAVNAVFVSEQNDEKERS